MLPSAVVAHELRPAYLDLRETASGLFDVVWKVPAMRDRRFGIDAQLPETCRSENEPRRSIEANAYFERRAVSCKGPLKGQQIGIDGLSATYTDALVRIAYVDGTVETLRLTPDAPETQVNGAQSTIEVAGA